MKTISIQPAPMACTLSVNDFKTRAAWLRGLTNRALLSHSVTDLTAYLIYRNDALKDVEELVRQEQSCCQFLCFAISHEKSGILLKVTAPQDAGEDAKLLFAHLIPIDS